jgi:adenylate cyclase
VSEDKKKLLGEVLLEKNIIEEAEASEALAENEGKKRLLGSILVDQKIITEQDLQDALEEQKRSSKRLGDILMARGLATQKDLMEAFSLQLQHQSDTTKQEPLLPFTSRIKEARIPIRVRLAVVITLLIVFIMSSASYFFYSSQKDEFLTQTFRFGTALVSNLSHNSSVALLENDEASLHILIEELSKMQDINYVMVLDKSGKIKAHSDITKIDSNYVPIQGATKLSMKDTLEIVKFRQGNYEVLDFMTPIKFSQVSLGAVHVGISMESLKKKTERFGIFILLLTTVLVLIGIGVSFYIGTQFSKPIINLVQGTMEIKHGNFSYRSERCRNDELGDLTLAFNDMAEGLRKKEVIQDAFGKYVNPEIVDMILKNPDNQWFQGKKIPATVMFTDIRGFTSFSEKTAPEEVVAALNEHFTTATAIILSHGGHVDKFIGDAVLAVFGALMEYDDHAERAVRTAVALQEAIRMENSIRTDSRQQLRIGIGINSGEVIAGNIGSQQRMEYTVIGDTVNLASRLTGIAGPGEIIISGSTYGLSTKKMNATKLDPVSVKGKSEPIEIYRVDGVV